MRLWLAALVLAAFSTQARAERVPAVTVDAKPTTGCSSAAAPFTPINIVRGTGEAWKCNAATSLWEPAVLPACADVATDPPAGACVIDQLCQGATPPRIWMCPDDGSPPDGTWTAPTGGVSGAGGVDTDVQVNVGGALGPIPGFKGNTSTGDVKMRGPISNVRAFGALCDGTTDDLAAFTAAAAAQKAWDGASGGGTIFVPEGTCMVSGPIVLAGVGMRLQGENTRTSVIKATAGFTPGVDGAIVVFKEGTTGGSDKATAAKISDLSIDANDVDAIALLMLEPYDQILIDNIYVDNCEDTYNCLRIVPTAEVDNVISQTIAINNSSFWKRGNTTGSSAVVYMERAQEVVITGSKAFAGSSAVPSTQTGPAWHFEGCRGVVLNGVSAALSYGPGFLVTGNTTTSTGIGIYTPTIETVRVPLQTGGTAGVERLALHNPRYQYTAFNTWTCPGWAYVCEGGPNNGLACNPNTPTISCPSDPGQPLAHCPPPGPCIILDNTKYSEIQANGAPVSLSASVGNLQNRIATQLADSVRDAIGEICRTSVKEDDNCGTMNEVRSWANFVNGWTSTNHAFAIRMGSTPELQFRVPYHDPKYWRMFWSGDNPDDFGWYLGFNDGTAFKPWLIVPSASGDFTVNGGEANGWTLTVNSDLAPDHTMVARHTGGTGPAWVFNKQVEAPLFVGSLSGSASSAGGVACTGCVESVDIADLGIGTGDMADNAVTYSKMQNISATQRVIGRDSALAGDPEEVSVSQLLDWLPSCDNGEIPKRIGTDSWGCAPDDNTGGGSLSVDGTPVSSPNLQDSTDILFTPSVSNIQATIVNNAVTYAKLQQAAGAGVLGHPNPTAANHSLMTAANDDEVMRRSGSTVGFGAINLASPNIFGASIMPGAKVQVNTLANAGVVPAGSGNANKVWATDGAGTPGWNTPTGSGGVTAAELASAAPIRTNFVNRANTGTSVAWSTFASGTSDPQHYKRFQTTENTNASGIVWSSKYQVWLGLLNGSTRLQIFPADFVDAATSTIIKVDLGTADLDGAGGACSDAAVDSEGITLTSPDGDFFYVSTEAMGSCMGIVEYSIPAALAAGAGPLQETNAWRLDDLNGGSCGVTNDGFEAVAFVPDGANCPDEYTTIPCGLFYAGCQQDSNIFRVKLDKTGSTSVETLVGAVFNSPCGISYAAGNGMDYDWRSGLLWQSAGGTIEIFTPNGACVQTVTGIPSNNDAEGFAIGPNNTLAIAQDLNLDSWFDVHQANSFGPFPGWQEANGVIKYRIDCGATTDPKVEGELCWDIDNDLMYVWNGSASVAVGSGSAGFVDSLGDLDDDGFPEKLDSPVTYPAGTGSVHTSSVANSSGAVAHNFNTSNSMSTSGARWLQVTNSDAVSKFAVEKGGATSVVMKMGQDISTQYWQASTTSGGVTTFSAVGTTPQLNTGTPFNGQQHTLGVAGGTIAGALALLPAADGSMVVSPNEDDTTAGSSEWQNTNPATASAGKAEAIVKDYRNGWDRSLSSRGSYPVGTAGASLTGDGEDYVPFVVMPRLNDPTKAYKTASGGSLDAGAVNEWTSARDVGYCSTTPATKCTETAECTPTGAGTCTWDASGSDPTDEWRNLPFPLDVGDVWGAPDPDDSWYYAGICPTKAGADTSNRYMQCGGPGIFQVRGYGPDGKVKPIFHVGESGVAIHEPDKTSNLSFMAYLTMFRSDSTRWVSGDHEYTPMFTFTKAGAFFDGGTFSGNSDYFPGFTAHTYNGFNQWVSKDVAFTDPAFGIEGSTSNVTGTEEEPIFTIYDRANAGGGSTVHPGTAYKSFNFRANSVLELASKCTASGGTCAGTVSDSQLVKYCGLDTTCATSTSLGAVEATGSNVILLPDVSGTVCVNSGGGCGGGGGSVEVEGSPVSSPDFIDSADIDFEASGSSVTGMIFPSAIDYGAIQNLSQTSVLGSDSGGGVVEELPATVDGLTFLDSTCNSATAGTIDCPAHATEGGSLTIKESTDAGESCGALDTPATTRPCVWQLKAPPTLGQDFTNDITAEGKIPVSALEMAQGGLVVGTDFTLNFMAGLNGGSGEACNLSSPAGCNLSTDSRESGFISDIALTDCSGLEGTMWVNNSTFGFCGASLTATPLYLARGNSSGEATLLNASEATAPLPFKVNTTCAGTTEGSPCWDSDGNTLCVGNGEGACVGVGGGGGGTFLSLTDTPDTYVGQGTKVVRVNEVASPDVLEFADAINVDHTTVAPTTGATTYYNATEGEYEVLANPGATGKILQSNNAAAPSWSTDGAHFTCTGGSCGVDTELETRIETISIDNPVAADSGTVQLMFPTAVTITRIACSTDTGTADIQFDERAAATPNTAGSNVLSSALQCVATEASTTTFGGAGGAGVASRVPLNLAMTVASTPTKLRIFVEYTVND